MADEHQVNILRQGVEAWNRWRKENSTVKIDFSEADLDGIRLRRADLNEANFNRASLRRSNFIEANLNNATFINSECYEASFSKASLSNASFLSASLDEANFWCANLIKANLSKAMLKQATFRKANLSEANLSEAELEGTILADANLNKAILYRTKIIQADLYQAQLNNAIMTEAQLYSSNFDGADLSNADLTGVNFTSANFSRANLKGTNLSDSILWGANLYLTDLAEANLTSADIKNASLVETNLENTILSNCRVYGISVWNLKGIPKDQSNLIITADREPEITVDDIQVAQFIYLLLNRNNLRNVIDTVTSKAVLILGRFTQERKVILDAMADELRKHNLLPIIFDFERSPSRDFTETLKILAGMSLFIIADITNPKSSPLELQATVPDYQIPFIPIIQEGEKPFAMFSDLIGKYDWVLKLFNYQSKEQLIKVFKNVILDRGWEKHKELQERKTAAIRTQSIDDFTNKSL